MKKPVLHLMVGLPCSGKSTLARILQKEENALLLSPDGWQLALFGDDFGGPDHDRRHSQIEMLLWELAKEALSIGANVILDYGFWAREERDGLRAEAERLGVGFQIHYLDTPLEEIARRLEKRNADCAGSAFRLTMADIEGWAGQFQPPDGEELGQK